MFGRIQSGYQPNTDTSPYEVSERALRYNSNALVMDFSRYSRYNAKYVGVSDMPFPLVSVSAPPSPNVVPAFESRTHR